MTTTTGYTDQLPNTALSITTWLKGARCRATLALLLGRDVPVVEASTGKSGGFDFGLKTFLTDHEGHEYHSPRFLKGELSAMAHLNRELARKQKGSNNRRKAKWRLAKAPERIANKYPDVHWK